MAEKKPSKRKVESYQHKDRKRLNNPPVGLVTPETDLEPAKKTYEYDPHLDPQLIWAGKAEHTSFEVPAVSLHVPERIDPRSIIEAVRRRNGNGAQMSLFAAPEENPPIRQAIEFYKHPHQLVESADRWRQPSCHELAAGKGRDGGPSSDGLRRPSLRD